MDVMDLTGKSWLVLLIEAHQLEQSMQKAPDDDAMFAKLEKQE
jgi:hypothetical protein